MIVLETLNTQLCLEEDLYNESLNILKKRLTSVISESIILQENAIGDFFKNLWEHIKTLWNKFIAGIDNVIKSNETWFKKYEKDLMNTNLRDFEWNMIPYWEGNAALERCKIPSFNPQDKEQLEYCESAESYRSWIKSKYLNNDKRVDTGDGFTDGLEYLFRGKDATFMKGSEIASQLRSCISYCKSFDSISQKVSQDYRNIERCVKYAQSNAIVRSNSSDKTTVNKSESFVFQEALVKETDNGKGGVKIEEKQNGNVKTKPVEDQYKKVNDANKELMEKRKENLSKNVDDTNKDKKDFKDSEITTNGMTKEQADARVNAYKNYVTVSQQVLSTKLKILKERYDMYMKMFKAILDLGIEQKNITGDKGNTGVQVKGKQYYEVQTKDLINLLNDKKSKSTNANEKKSINDYISRANAILKDIPNKSANSIRTALMKLITEIRSIIPDIKITITKKK